MFGIEALTPKTIFRSPKILATKAHTPVWGVSQGGNVGRTRKLVDAVAKDVDVMETLTHGGQVPIEEMRKELLDRRILTHDEYPSPFFNPYAKKAFDTAAARDMPIEQIKARRLFFASNPTEVGFAKETGSPFRHRYLSGLSKNSQGRLQPSEGRRYILRDGASIFELTNDDLRDPSISRLVRRRGIAGDIGGQSPPVGVGKYFHSIGNTDGLSRPDSGTTGNIGAGGSGVVVNDPAGVAQATQRMRSLNSGFRDRQQQAEAIQASIAENGSGATNTASTQRIQDLITQNRRIANALDSATVNIQNGSENLAATEQHTAQQFNTVI